VRLGYGGPKAAGGSDPRRRVVAARLPASQASVEGGRPTGLTGPFLGGLRKGFRKGSQTCDNGPKRSGTAGETEPLSGGGRNLSSYLSYSREKGNLSAQGRELMAGA